LRAAETRQGSSSERKPEFKVTGTPAELATAVQAAIIDGALKESEIVELVDALEENGGQHIILFDISDAGKKALTPKAFVKAFDPFEKPTEAFYSQYPPGKQIRYELREGRVIVVKQVFTTQFWRRNESDTEETDTRRTVVYDRVRRRSINLFLFDTETGRIEVRVDHVHGKDDKLAQQLFLAFRDDLLKLVDFEDHLIAVDVSRAYKGIIGARDETFMSIDEAFDGSASMRFAKMREAAAGRDIRDHPGHAKAIIEKSVGRNAVRVYWLIGKNDDQRRVHTIVSTMDYEGKDGDTLTFGKAYVPAKIDPKDLDHALARIRHFAR
jgi:hypothetical protein